MTWHTGRSVGVMAVAISSMAALLGVVMMGESPVGASPASPARTRSGPAGDLGYFEGHEDVGSPAIPGSASYDAAAQSYTVTAAGTNMWDARDEFHVVWRRMSGDFIVRTHAAFVGAGTDPHRKMGWIVRTSLKPDSAHVGAAVHGDGLTSLQFRRAAGARTEEVRSAVTGAQVIQLERRGQTYVMSVARFGETFTRSEVTDVDARRRGLRRAVRLRPQPEGV